jgi:glycosyltransferase involved in cell wall biosynthesis
MAARLRSYRVNAAVVRPWVFAEVIKQAAAALHIRPKPEWTWIYSGNLGRAHDWATLLEVQAILEARGAGCRLLFQGGGPAWPAARSRADELELKNCAWSGYVDEEQLAESLLASQLLAVTQLPAAQGLLWPSKLALAISLPRPLLWIGPKAGAVADLLRTFPHAGVFSAGEPAQIADWIIALKERPTLIEASATFDAARHRQSSIEQLATLILDAGAMPSQRSSGSSRRIIES